MKTRTWLVAILGCYIAACALPAFGRGEDYGTPGIVCLIAIPSVLILPYWWANPLFFAGCLALGLRRGRLAAKLGLVASILAISFGIFCQFDGLRLGYLFWVISMLWLTRAGYACRHEGGKPAVIDRSETLWANPEVDGFHGTSSGPAPGVSSASNSSVPLSSRSPS